MSIVEVIVRGNEGDQAERQQSAHASLAESAQDEPDNGVYLVARTYRGGHVLELDAHFDRMERSAAARGRAIRVPRHRIRALLREMLRELAPAAVDGRFRVTAVLDETPWFRLAMEPAADVDPELLRRGVHCTVLRGAIRTEAEVKSTAWIAERRSLAAAAGVDAPSTYEYLLARTDGAILEGAGSNFYACIGGVVRTAGDGVLKGIARRIVLTVARELDPAIAVDFEPATIGHLKSGVIEEAFITSATRGVVPVRSIDSTELGSPGPVTTEISRRYNTWLETHLTPL